MKDKLIVGCGYIGHRVAKLWLANDESVMALTRSNERAEQFQKEGIRPLLGDVVDPKTAFADVGQIATCLSAVGFDRFASHSKQEVYVDGLQRVLEQIGDRVEHFVYVSSSSVYGQSDGEWIDEDSPTEPSTEGGEICLAAEQLLQRFFESKPTRLSILRFVGIYGPDRVLRRVDSLRNGEPIAGNPDAYLNLIHADDGAAAVVACAQVDRLRDTSPEMFLVSDGQELTRRTYFETLARLVDAPKPVFDSAAPAGSRPPKAGLNKRCRNQRVIEKLGLTLQHPTIETGLRHSLGIA